MEYIISTTKDKLRNIGFHYNKEMSEEGSDIYSMRFPVARYKKLTTLEGEISIELQTGRVITNVYNCGINDIYSPYYYREYGKNILIKSIEHKISFQLKKIGVVKVKK